MAISKCSKSHKFNLTKTATWVASRFTLDKESNSVKPIFAKIMDFSFLDIAFIKISKNIIK